ncbi:MAG: NFACT family protein [Anaerolineae bacterium]|nr:NFACT family protein [Anaerolineae bacterium]
MYFDYFTAAALVDELNEKLVGGRVQKIVEIDDVSLGLEIYSQRTRHYLFLSADPTNARIHLAEDKLRRGAPVDSPLTLRLKKHIDGAGILAIRQPRWERIVILDFSAPDGEYSLILEPVERRANIILVGNDVILECVRRVGADENRVRQLLPGYEYQPPPPQNKLPPGSIISEDIKRFLDEDVHTTAPQSLTRRIHGMSPQLAREIIFRATGRANCPAADSSPRGVFSAYQEIMQPLLEHNWNPGITLEKDRVTAYSVYPMMHKSGWQAVGSISSALEQFYGEVSGEAAYEAGKKPIYDQIKNAGKRLKGKLFSLQKQQRDESEVEKLRQTGELLLTYQFQIKKGMTDFEAQYDYDSPALKIKLDPLKTAVENAQTYFEKYEKAKRSRAALPDLILNVERELRYLAQLETDLDIAASWPEIGEVQEALQQAGYWKGPKVRQPAGQKSAPYKVVANDGTVIWIGRNSRQNEEVTFTKGANEDIWMHARGVPGSHVVVKAGGRKVSDAVLQEAAAYAAYYSKARSEKKVDVIVTERKHIRKIKGGKPGMVRVMEQSHPTLRTEPRPVLNKEK